MYLLLCAKNTSSFLVFFFFFDTKLLVLLEMKNLLRHFYVFFSHEQAVIYHVSHRLIHRMTIEIRYTLRFLSISIILILRLRKIIHIASKLIMMNHIVFMCSYLNISSADTAVSCYNL